VNTQTKGLPMNITSKIIIASAVSILLTQVVLALSDTNKPSDYSVIALKNCDVVSDKAMTAEQLEAYLSLEQQQQKMQTLELPIQGIEKEISLYSDEIEKLTKLAIQETSDTLHINKALLKKQEVVVKELSEFMQQHQQSFDALGEQGNIIGQQAEIFASSIKANLESIDYDQIRVLTPDSHTTKLSCDGDIKVSVI
jgi:delta 1-pyrroline-5-carboxylate dehydrogenase